jgi:hypothetical protein
MRTRRLSSIVFATGAAASFAIIGAAADKLPCPCCSSMKHRCCLGDQAVNEAPTVEAIATNSASGANDVVQCLLSTAQLAERRAQIQTDILSQVAETVETDNGYKLKFAEPDDKLIATLTQWIVAERKCCNFLRFELSFEQFAGPVWLELGGEPGTKQFLQKVLEQRPSE